jgi:hypothetical protein
MDAAEVVVRACPPATSDSSDPQARNPTLPEQLSEASRLSQSVSGREPPIDRDAGRSHERCGSPIGLIRQKLCRTRIPTVNESKHDLVSLWWPNFKGRLAHGVRRIVRRRQVLPAADSLQRKLTHYRAAGVGVHAEYEARVGARFLVS